MATYTVKAGDTLTKIGNKYGIDYNEIAKANGIENVNKIQTGQVLNIPDGTSGSASASGNKSNNTAAAKYNLNFAGVDSNLLNDYAGSTYQRSDNVNAKYDESQNYKNQAIYQQTESETVKQADSFLNQLMNRDPFSYDFSNDPLFQNMLGSYQAMGQNAMKDTVAQSSALTGGYANSWAQTAGQQTYNQYLQDAFNNLPEYYQLALQTYENEGNRLKDSYNLLSAKNKESVDFLMNMYGLTQEEAIALDTYERALYDEEQGKRASMIEWQSNEHWKNKEYNDAQSARAKDLAMEEAKMEASGYVKQSDGTWKYVGSDEDEEAKTDERISAIIDGASVALDKFGTTALYDFLKSKYDQGKNSEEGESVGIKDDDELSTILQAFGLPSNWLETKEKELNSWLLPGESLEVFR